MKPQTTHQEVLLLNRTGLLKSQSCPNSNDPDNQKRLSLSEQLEKACWDGLLSEILPEVILKPVTGCRNFLWELFTTQNFIHFSMGSHPYSKKGNASIDPCYFFQSLSLN